MYFKEWQDSECIEEERPLHRHIENAVSVNGGRWKPETWGVVLLEPAQTCKSIYRTTLENTLDHMGHF